MWRWKMKNWKNSRKSYSRNLTKWYSQRKSWREISMPMMKISSLLPEIVCSSSATSFARSFFSKSKTDKCFSCVPLKWQLVEPGAWMSAKNYRDKKALPLVEKLKEVVKNLRLRIVLLFSFICSDRHTQSIRFCTSLSVS